MRRLNAKQKKMLTEYSKNNRVLGLEMYEALEQANDYETLWQDAERFIHDKRMERIDN